MMISELVYLVLLSLFLVHELDAVAQSEWRLLPLLRRLPEAKVRAWFIGLHVPLFAVIIYASYIAPTVVSDMARMIVSGFAIVHVGLHYAFRNNPNYSFTSGLSKALIYGPGLFGAAYIGVVRL